ncbi:hypothetical protein HMPREF1861_00267 [Corynebacterium kroppenstedtii]|nr:hypothetical protein HMPREF1861_00267 [Corynebacterium kroppenstedtii]
MLHVFKFRLESSLEVICLFSIFSAFGLHMDPLFHIYRAFKWA